MDITQWSNEYSLGIEDIDEQHKALIECLAGLERSMTTRDERQRWSAIHYAIVQLTDYTRIHFAVEESLMRIMRYPEVNRHCSQHQMFIAYLREVERKSINFDVSEDEIVSFLRQWLIAHILEEDKRYANYFAEFWKDRSG